METQGARVTPLAQPAGQLLRCRRCCLDPDVLRIPHPAVLRLPGPVHSRVPMRVHRDAGRGPGQP